MCSQIRWFSLRRGALEWVSADLGHADSTFSVLNTVLHKAKDHPALPAVHSFSSCWEVTLSSQELQDQVLGAPVNVRRTMFFLSRGGMAA